MAHHRDVIVSPSILSADILNLGAELKSVEAGGAGWHHIDVMDGHYVENLTFGLPLIRAVKKVSKLPVDVHIMVTNPDHVAVKYVDAGADYLTFHPEVAFHSLRVIQAIHQHGGKAGIAVNPGISLSTIAALLPYVDMVNMMSVNPGFGGQTFIQETVERVEQLSAMLEAIGRHADVHIQVDGGVDASNAASLVKAGATVLVAGNYVYGHADRQSRIQSLKQSSKG